ncbi:MAG: 3-phosphoshikimate 1-carboxyvinyltransferase, partial [Bacteroidales bacterium]|nr:3-phosphoshikimate 1-carboxyvinyltransferase [Bacteroidales bacterium]
MKITIHPSHLIGTVNAPPSKSLTQRAIAAGLLSQGTTVIRNPSYCSDAVAATGMAESLGASVTRNGDALMIESGLRPGSSPVTLHCGESGLAMRMFAPLAVLLRREVTFTGEGSLTGRPVLMIKDALEQMGVRVETSGGHLPVTLTGELSPGTISIDGSAGSQLLTGLLMALPLLSSDSEIIVHNLKSRPYISLTVKLLEDFGISIENNSFTRFKVPGNQKYKAREYIVEGDWSGAAFLLVAGAIAGKVTLTNLIPDSLQADMAVVDVLRKSGAKLVADAGMITSIQSPLKAFTFEAADSPDLFPPLAALAAYCKGTSRISGVSRLAHKESNRSRAIIDVLAAMNISARVEGDDLLIDGGEVRGAVVSSFNDHRIAMMAAVMALGSRGEVTITGAEAINKSFPEFFEYLRLLGARIS